MNEADLPMLPWFVAQFNASTCHWSGAERAAYRELLDAQWLLGVLPAEPERLARLARMTPDQFAEVWPTVGMKFTSCTGGIRNDRLERHRVNALELRRVKAQNARNLNARRGVKRDEVRDGVRSEQRGEQRASKSESESISLDSLSRASEPEKVSRETVSAGAWRDTPGLNVDAFAAYLEHIALLVEGASVRRFLWPHEQLEQARWLAQQGSHSRQFDVVRDAIRHGWKRLSNDGEAPKRVRRRTPEDEAAERAERIKAADGPDLP
jgi:uncharacterized protein YdaU (DUF1376 family)